MSVETIIRDFKNKEFAIYALIDPRSKEWRYIGKTEQNVRTRFNVHWCDAWRKNKKGEFVKNLHVYRWIRSLEGIKPEIEKLEQWQNHDELVKAEMEWIAEAKRAGCRLTNHTDGGEGSVGYKHSKEVCKKISEKKTGGTHIGVPKTAEDKLKISRTKTGLTREQQDAIAADYLVDSSISAGNVGGKYGVSATAVYTIINALGFKTRTQSETMKSIKSDKELEVAEKYLSGKSTKELTCEYGVSAKTILNLLNRLKIKQRPRAFETWNARRKNGT